MFVAFSTWTRDKVRSLAEILLDQGAIDDDDRAALSAMAARHLKRHGGDAEKSLAAIAVGPSARAKLAALGDADLTSSVGFVGSDTPSQDATATMSVGTATSDGQRFRVLRPHARGGLGAVFVALDGELNREVALKQILDHHADDPSSRTRFLLEAEITGGLEHPGIVPVYGLGHHGDGRPYYAMRFIRGDSLKEAIAGFHSDESLKQDPGKRSLALRKLLRRFVDVCNAIDYAHGRGVLHRDLKPGNVIVGKHGETLVIDWGLAKPMGHSEVGTRTDERTLIPSSSSGSAETLPGSAIGTPSYMSPEQAVGDLDRLGPRSDVYSLGATLYCLLTGKAPFEGDDPGAILQAVQKGGFPRPRQVAPAIDRALEAVCLKAMATNPEDRHASARALADDVDRWTADEPTSAWREPVSVRARRWMRRNRTAVTAASATVLMAVVGLAGVLAVQSRANEALTAKNIELDKANRLKDEANAGLLQANARLEAKNAELDDANAQVKARFELAREAIRSFQQGVTEDAMLKGEELKGLRNKLLSLAAGFYQKLEMMLQGQADLPSRAILAQSYYELGGLTEKIGIKAEALIVERKALAIRRELASRPEADSGARLDLARSLNAIGGLVESVGDNAGALSSYEEARDVAGPLATGPRATDEARNVLAASHQGIGRVLSIAGKMAEAMDSYGRALVIRRKLAADNPTVTEFLRSLADSLISLGALQSWAGHKDAGLESFNQAFAIQEKLADDNLAVTESRSLMAESHTTIGEMQFRSGQLTEALESHRRALAIRQKLAKDNPAVTEFRKKLVLSLNRIGILQSRIGQLAEAVESNRLALETYSKLVADNPNDTNLQSEMAYSENNIGHLRLFTGNLAEAMESYRRALAIRQKLVADNPAASHFRLDLGYSHNNIGNLLAAMGHPAEALESHRRALAIRQKLADDEPAGPQSQIDLATSLNAIGNLLALTGHPAEAVEPHRRALAIRQKLAEAIRRSFQEKNNLADSHANLADALRGLGRIDEALDGYRQAIAILEPMAKSSPAMPAYRSDLASTVRRLGLARDAAGDLAGALADARQALALFEGLPSRSDVEWYEMACVRSALAALAGRGAPGTSAVEAEPEAARAMDLLRKAVAEGYRNTAAIRTESALEPLRSRPEFRLLMDDLTFPADPFAR